MKSTIIGRKSEQAILTDLFKSKKAEFLAVYGRRRIGKTYLIEKFFQQKSCLYFHTTGLQNGSLQEQLTIPKFLQNAIFLLRLNAILQ